jgi:hypothetical protein
MLRGGPLVGSPARTSTFLGSVAALAGRWWLIARRVLYILHRLQPTPT